MKGSKGCCKQRNPKDFLLFSLYGRVEKCKLYSRRGGGVIDLFVLLVFGFGT